MRHITKKTLPLVFASGLLASSFAQAAQLGRLEILSGANEPFAAQIQIESIQPEERASLQAKLASPEAFRAARLTIDPNLQSLSFSVQDGPSPGSAVVSIKADKPLPAGFIDALVELTWAGGRVAREYTLTIPVGNVNKPQPSSSLPEIRPPRTAPILTAKPGAGEQFETPKADSVRVEPEKPEVKPPTEKPVAARTEPQPGEGLTVNKGDTLSELAIGLVGDGVTLNQAMAALYEANRDAFINGSVHLIREGARIQVPNRSALRAKSPNEALVVLANNDDRNVYSAYARQIGLLTVEQQAASASDPTASQGRIDPKPVDSVSAPAQEDRLQIAPGAAQGGNTADSSAEELLAKSKALSEANERIALLEKNVTDLQRLLEMQQETGAPSGSTLGVGGEAQPAGEETAPPQPDELPVLDVPSETLAQAGELEVEPTEPEEEPQAQPETPVEQPFNWLPWVLGGVAGLFVLVVFILVARARKAKQAEEQSAIVAEDDKDPFSEVNEFDEAVASASAEMAAQRDSKVSEEESTDFDLDEVLKERLGEAGPARDVSEKSQAEPEKTVAAAEIPDMQGESDEAAAQRDSLQSDVDLDFPDDEAASVKENSILDDLDSLEKGALSAQNELDELRKQPPAPSDASADESEETEQEDAADSTEEEPVELDVDVPGPKLDDATWQEVATKLDLAGAYVEIGDSDGAKELLTEIIKKGDAEQVKKAKALLATL